MHGLMGGRRGNPLGLPYPGNHEVLAALADHAGQNPSRVREASALEVVYERCAGIDIGKREIVVCMFTPGEGRSRRQKEIRSFGTTTSQLLEMATWLQEQGCEVAAMESTGVFWKPLYNVLESVMRCMLVNPQQIKGLPGRKTDVKDSEWIADLLQHGLVRPSFVPQRPQRELRELIRYRSSLVGERAREVNRLQKVLEGANVKLASVVSDILGVSGRAMLKALAGGDLSTEDMAHLAKGKLKDKIPQLQDALHGLMASHQRFMLATILDHIDKLEELIKTVSEEIAERMDPHQEVLERLETIPGVGRRAAEAIVAEVGTDTAIFPTAQHLASWAGLCPGNKSSGGKRLSGHIRNGNPSLRGALIEAAWSVARTDTYLGAQFRRLSRLKGAKRAIVAVAHSILVIVWHVLHKGESYTDLGSDYFAHLDDDRAVKAMVRRLQGLGYDVVPRTPAA